jgi:succinylarginine dihydrolase
MADRVAVEAREILERSGLAPAEYQAFLNAVQALLTSDSATLHLRLTEAQRQAWVQVFMIFSRSLQLKSTEAAEPSRRGLYPVRMKRKEYLAIKRLAQERQFARETARWARLNRAIQREENRRSSPSLGYRQN